MRRCRSCGIRWQQTVIGLCRRCVRTAQSRAAIAQYRREDRETQRQAQRAHEAMNLEQVIAHRVPPSPTGQPAVTAPARTVIVGARAYEVVWDGTRG